MVSFEKSISSAPVWGGGGQRGVVVRNKSRDSPSPQCQWNARNFAIFSFLTILIFDHLKIPTIRCGPCRMIAPHFESMSTEYASNAIFVKVDVDVMEKLAQQCGIRAMPTFQFYKNGEKVDEFSGADIATLKAKVAALV